MELIKQSSNSIFSIFQSCYELVSQSNREVFFNGVSLKDVFEKVMFGMLGPSKELIVVIFLSVVFQLAIQHLKINERFTTQLRSLRDYFGLDANPRTNFGISFTEETKED